jgi:signal transduction histidine kinase/FixJ family two-component response regulator
MLENTKYEILYIDDEIDNLVAFKSAFRREYNVHTAESGQEGLQILDSNSEIAAVITDHRMPKMTGLELLKLIQNKYDIAKIILTGFSDVEVTIEAINNNLVDKFKTKPWDRLKLGETISEEIQKRRAKKENSLLNQRIQDTLQKLNIVLNTSKVAVWELNKTSGDVSFYKNSFDVFSLIGQIDISFEQLLDTLPTGNRDIFRQTIEGMTTKKDSFFLDHRVRTNDESDLFLNSQGTLIENENNEQSVIVASRDITERIKAEEKVKLLNKNLEGLVIERTKKLIKINNEKDDLLNMVSHDLRNPLSGIILYIGMLISRIENSEEIDFPKGLIYLRDAAQRMNYMIEKLLESSKIESGNLDINKSNFNLNKLISNLIVNNLPMFDRKHQKILINSNKDTELNTDEGLFTQILENLLSNASKYSEPDTNIFINQEIIDKSVRIEIRDQGQGMSEEDKKNLFKKFSKISSKPTAGESTVGLGLSITKNIVEALGGKIWCESQLGKGSSFFVEFKI